MSLVSVDEVTKKFGSRVGVDGVTFRVERGESVALFGANGAGKTTLIRMLGSLSRPTDGTVKVDGDALDGANPSLRSKIGLVSHDSMLYDGMTALENLRLHARVHGVEKSVCLDRLRTVGLRDWRGERVGRFSHGMRKRLSLARALLHDPELLLLDEPFSGLDQESLETAISVLSGFDERSVVVATHDLERGAELVDRALFLDDGRLVDDVPVDDRNVREIYRNVTAGNGR